MFLARPDYRYKKYLTMSYEGKWDSNGLVAAPIENIAELRVKIIPYDMTSCRLESIARLNFRRIMPDG